MPIRLVVAEDSYLVREGIEKVIGAEDDIEVVGACGDFDTLLATVAAQEPDVVLTDIRMPPTSTDEGIRAANDIRERFPKTGVVVLSQYLEPEYALALLEKGCEGRAYLLKERVAESDQLVSAIREVARGGSVVDPKVVEALVARRSHAPATLLDRLTPREREVLVEMAKGGNNAAIATALVLSARAVEKHINSIFSKLCLSEEPDVHRRVRAVLLYLAEQEG